MTKHSHEIMKEAMIRADLVKHQDELMVIRAPRPAKPSELLKLQRHMNKPNGYSYLLQNPGVAK